MRAGKKLGSIAMPETPSNCAWGEGFRGLYVTARSSVYRLRANVNGTRTINTFLLALAGYAMARLKSAAPVEVGMSAERLARAAGLLKAEVDSEKLGAAAILVARDGRIVLHEGYGRLSREPGALAVRTGADLCSRRSQTSYGMLVDAARATRQGQTG